MIIDILKEKLKLTTEDVTSIGIDDVERIGQKNNQDFPRPLMAQFKLSNENLLNLAYDKDNSLKNSKICIGIQCSPHFNEKRKQLDYVEKNLETNTTIKQRNGTLIIDEYAPTNNLKILFWNIHSLPAKFRTSKRRFETFVSEYDIVLLSETMITNEQKNEFKLDRYKQTHFPGKRSPSDKKDSKRVSGGLSCFIRETFANESNIYVENHEGSEDEWGQFKAVMWIKIDKTVIAEHDDVYVGHTYIPPYTSNITKTERGTTQDRFTCLKSQISKYLNMGKVFVCGDFNSRASNLQDNIHFDILVGDSTSHFRHTSNTPNLPARACNDSGSNQFTDKLLALCSSTGLRIVNGRLHEDTIGNITCFAPNGNSSVDYLLTCAENFEMIKEFAVLQKQTISDHCPLFFSLPNTLTFNISECP